MVFWAGPAAIAEGLLVMAGAGKVISPLPAVHGLRSVGVKLPVHVVRAGALAEAATGGAALVSGWPILAALVGLSYLSFAAFVAAGLRSGSAVSSCGCFGEAGGVPTKVHLAINLAAGAAATGAAAWPVGSLWSIVSHQPLAGLLMVGYVILGCWLCWAALTLWPPLAAATHRETNQSVAAIGDVE